MRARVGFEELSGAHGAVALRAIMQSEKMLLARANGALRMRSACERRLGHDLRCENLLHPPVGQPISRADSDSDSDFSDDERSLRLPTLQKDGANWKAHSFKLLAVLDARRLHSAFQINIPAS